MKKIFLILVISFFTNSLFAQVANWGFRVGGVNNDGVLYLTRIAKDYQNNIIKAGSFSSPATDINPSPTVFNGLNTNGLDDALLVKYDSIGNLLWGVSFGGPELDGITSVSFDTANNIYITGYYRNTVDFDPGPGVFIMTSQPNGGTANPYAGDILVAKFTSNGSFVWAKSIGGGNVNDMGLGIAVSKSGSVYVGGQFNGGAGLVDFDPSPTGTYNLDAVNGLAYVLKLNNNGDFVWAFNCGGASQNASIQDIDFDNAGNLILSGVINGTNFDMDPSPTNIALANTIAEDILIAKFDTNMNYDFHMIVQGAGIGGGTTIKVYNNSIYVTGIASGNNLNFNPLFSPSTSISSAGGMDIYIAKYSVQGQLIWVKVIGSSQNDFGYGVDVINNSVYVTGQFNNTIDFDPGPGFANLTSAGNGDGFVWHLDTNGNYKCSFAIGSSGSDLSSSVIAQGNDSIYINGTFNNSVNFSPNPPQLNIASNGGRDNFLMHYYAPSCLPSIILNNDTSLCSTSPIQLNTSISNPSSFSWSPTTGLSNANILNPIANPSVSTTYVLTAINNGANLITNPDFSSGNIGFTSTYTYQAPTAGNNTAAAEYTVGTNPSPWNNWAFSCTDHTTGTGQMLIVNGATTPNVSVWSQTIPVQPNSNYNFSAWVSNWSNVSPSVLQFQINGTTLGAPYNAPNTTCAWTQFFQNWNSGAATSATISILNQSTALMGNDFSIDDVFFGLVDTLVDSVTISILQPPTANAGSTITVCQGAPIQLNGTSNGASVQWSPAASLSNGAILNPTSNAATNTIYTLTTTGSNGCTATSSVNVNISPQTIANAGADLSICAGNSVQLNGSGGTTYLWAGPALSNASIANPTVSPSANATYTLTVSNAAGCSSTDVVQVTVANAPTLAVSPSTTICANTNSSLSASGAQSFTWQPAASLNNATLGNPIASPATTTIYTVVGSNGTNCSSTATVSVNVLNTAVITISGLSSICEGDTTTLTANGGNNYTWLPAGFSNTTNGASINAYPTATTTFTISSTDANNCTASTIKQVVVNAYPLANASKANDIQCSVNSAQLTMSSATSYTWSPSATLNNATISSPIASPLSTTTYTVLAANGTCVTLDSVTVIVYDNLLSKIYVPNAITPNNDDINDCLRVISNSKFTEFEFRVFNRWGNQVFYSQDPNACWDGSFNGKEGNNVNNTYFYLIRCKTECGSIERKGDVLLLDQY
jgi:gliding motility-associated-like protein